jgi:hypothetical protein
VCLQVRRQNEAAVLTVEGKIIPQAQKKVTELISYKDEEHAHCLFQLLEVWCTVSLFLEVEQCTRNSTSQFYSI